MPKQKKQAPRKKTPPKKKTTKTAMSGTFTKKPVAKKRKTKRG
jgi:hypothetical protein